MRDDKENIIVQRTFDFSLKIILFSEELRLEKKFEMASQLFKSGTSIGANIREAQNAESPADFLHKFKISAKECEETQYWLQLCKESQILPSPNEEIITELEIIMRIISKIISTSKKR
ncbi:four helix bundle protein [Gramella sp. KN1008]|uniref:four helix bundle protein n=1 Tax=Gramella sp. KN1008 TaxID=2529298 RepID=UPI00103E2C27|nr:four helix bundle protein [Gramella sp. KN1008]TBW27792.1 four helix bundle protein [Gramella sp. KN1008]